MHRHWLCTSLLLTFCSSLAYGPAYALSRPVTKIKQPPSIYHTHFPRCIYHDQLDCAVIFIIVYPNENEGLICLMNFKRASVKQA